VEWAYELSGRSGIGLAGIAPLSYPVVEAWARLSDVRLEPHEVRALVMLDDALRDPDLAGPAEDEAPEEQPRPEAPQWPERRRAPVFVVED